MPFPFTAQRFVMEPFDLSHSFWARYRDNILPFLVAFQNINRRGIQLTDCTTVLEYSPHTLNSINTI